MAAPAISSPASNHNGRSKRSTSCRSRPRRASAIGTVAAVLGVAWGAAGRSVPLSPPPRVDRVATWGAGELLYRGTFLIRGSQGSLRGNAFLMPSRQ